MLLTPGFWIVMTDSSARKYRPVGPAADDDAQLHGVPSEVFALFQSG